MEETLKPLAGQLAQQLGQQLSQASGAVPGTGALADGLSQGGADLTAPKAHYEAGMAAKQAGDLQRAAQELAEASRLAPDWADPHWALAWVYAGMGDKPRAIEAFNQVVLLDKDRAVEARQAILRLTPPSSLYDAAVKGDIETAKRLIAAGAEISASGDSFGNTPLDVAANRDNAALVELLIGHGADVRGGPDPQTALHNAAFYGCPAAARVLLRHGADPKARGERGHTPLHLAARKGHTDIAKLLLEHRSDINARDTEGKTPLTYALDASQTAMADFLRARGGKQ
jgi:tetratricopeptide (TPR) repeat protein